MNPYTQDCDKECEYAKACIEVKKLTKFKQYFDDLYGQGLEVANWHMNGETEPFDNFYEGALAYMEEK